VQTIAEALDLHPVMLSRWRQEAREGRLRGREAAPTETPPKVPVRELKQLQALEKAHALLQEEHELLKNHRSTRGRTTWWTRNSGTARLAVPGEQWPLA